MSRLRLATRSNIDTTFASFTFHMDHTTPISSALERYLCAQGIFHMVQIGWRSKAEEKISDINFMAAFLSSHESFFKPLSVLRYLGLESIRDGYQTIINQPQPHSLQPSLENCKEVSDFFYEIGFYPEGIVLAKRVYDSHRMEFGEESPITQKSINGLANLYFQNDQNDEAKELYLRLLQLEEEQNAPVSDRSTTMNNLGVLYSSEGEMDKAEDMLLRNVKICTENRSDDEEAYIRAVNNLATHYYRDEEYTKSEPLMVQVREGCETMFGVGHPKTISAMNNLGQLYKSQERYEESLALNLKSLNTSRNILGPSHPYTITSLDNTGSIYQYLGQYEKSEEMHLQALEESEKFLGADHSQTMIIVNNLALLYEETGREKEAEMFFLRDLHTSGRVLGLEHPETLMSAYNLAGMYRSQKRYDEAKPLLKRVLDSSEEQLGTEDDRTLDFRYRYATLLIALKDFDAAFKHLEITLKNITEHHDSDHPLLSLTHWSLALCLRKKKRPAEAAQHRRSCLALEIEESDGMDEDLLFTVFNLAQDLIAAKEIPSAIYELETALEVASQLEEPPESLQEHVKKLTKFLEDLKERDV